MPNRVLWPAITRSRKINSLSPEAEVLFYRLLVSADDWGRFYAEPMLVLAECFPLKLGKVTVREITEWLGELVRVRLIRIYEAEGEAYLSFGKWQQRSRAGRSKYPDMLADDGQLTVIGPSHAHVDEDGDEDVHERASRKRDPLFDVLAEVEGSNPLEMTQRGGRTIGVALAEIRKATPDVTPDEIRRRASLWPKHFPDAAFTASALAKHWARMGASGSGRPKQHTYSEFTPCELCGEVHGRRP
jgi:hypothetical protein